MAAPMTTAARNFLPDDRGPKCEPQRGDRGRDGDDDRERDQDTIVAKVGRHQHRGHAGVMHRHNTDAHEKPAKHQLKDGRLPRADDVKTDPRDHDGNDKGQNRQAEIVADRHRHPAGQHCDEVHRPDAAAHCERGRREPRAPWPILRHPDPAAEVERRIGGETRDRE
jgi:hypothetical protein